MKHNNHLTYIMSGCSHTRIVLNGISDDGYESIRKIMTQLNTENPDHTFGLLYNAWAETKFGKIFQDQYASSIKCIQADSGGLQVVTQGKTITEQMKLDVYKNQGTYSDMAMSFDEIPLAFSGGKSSRLDLGNRWFDRDRHDECAAQTGRNIKKQIETFLELKSKAKPILITQGNCYDTYMRWTEKCLAEIPMELQPYIGGVAMGAAALGHGMLEDIKRAFYFTQLPMNYPVNHLHLLAVGSAYRLVPNLIFLDSGLYKDLHLTIDSTTHASGVNMGRVYMDRKGYDFPRHFDQVIYKKMHDRINEAFGDDGLSLQDFHRIVNMPGSKYKEEFGSVDGYSLAFFRLAAFAVREFKKHVDECVASRDVLMDLVDKRELLAVSALNQLYHVRDKSDFVRWEKDVGRYVTSKSVANNQVLTFDDFFE